MAGSARYRLTVLTRVSVTDTCHNQVSRVYTVCLHNKYVMSLNFLEVKTWNFSISVLKRFNIGCLIASVLRIFYSLFVKTCKTGFGIISIKDNFISVLL